MCNDTGRSPRCEASSNRFLPAKMKGRIGKFGVEAAASC